MKSRRTLQTILFTDIVGSTERATELGDHRWHELLDEHHARVRREIRRFRGREVKTTGDGFLVAFPRPALAVRCAWAIREAVRKLGLEVRGGIHMGAVEHHGKDLGGIVIHVGARIASVAEPGEILVSNAVRESEMGTGFQFEDRGKHKLKGIEGEWRLFSLEALPAAPYRLRPRLFGIGGRPLTIAGAALVVLVIAAGAYFVMRNLGSSAGPGEAIAGAAPAIAVLPFRVGSEDLATWREGMVDVLSTNLDGIPGLRAIDSHTLLARWREGVEDEEMPDTKTALAIARRTGARYAIQGRVIPAGENLRIVAELYDAESGQPLSRAQVEGAVDSLFGLVDQLSIQLMRGIVESEEDLSAIDLARATTDTLEALRAYLEGEVHARRDDWIPAVEAYERAVAADSTFALAWLQLSVANAWGATLPGASLERAFEAGEQALRYAERLPERDALLVRGWAVVPDRGIPTSPSERLGGLEALLELTRKYPDDVLGWFLLGDTVFHTGGPLMRDPDEDRNAFERAIQIDPGFLPAYNHFIDDVMRTDPDSARWAELRATKASLAPPGTPGTGEGPIIMTLAFGAPEERGPSIAALDTVSNSIDCIFCIALLGFSHPRFLDVQGDLLKAALLKNNWEPLVATVWLLRNLLFRGRLSDALEAVESPFDIDELLYLPHVSGYPIPTDRLEAALGPEPEEPRYRYPTAAWGTEQVVQHAFRGAWALERDRPEVYRESLAALRSLEQEWLNDADSLRGSLFAGFAAGGIDALEGFRAWREGRSEQAAELLERARLRTIAEFYPLNIVVRWWQAQMALEEDELEKAAEYLLSLSHGEVLTTDPWATYQLARAQEELGLHYEARENYEYFALAWRDADPRFQPLVQQARQAASRLRGIRRD